MMASLRIIVRNGVIVKRIGHNDEITIKTGCGDVIAKKVWGDGLIGRKL